MSNRPQGPFRHEDEITPLPPSLPVSSQPNENLITDAPKNSSDPPYFSESRRTLNDPNIATLISLLTGIVSLILAYIMIPFYITLTTDKTSDGLGLLGVGFILAALLFGSLLVTLLGLIFGWLALANQHTSKNSLYIRLIAILALLFQVPNLILYLVIILKLTFG